MTTSGRAVSSMRAISASRRRSCWRLRGTNGAGQPWRARHCTTHVPRKPAPPVTTTRFPCQNPAIELRTRQRLAAVEVGLHHEAHEIGEVDLRLPAELVARLAGVAQEHVDLGWPLEQGIDHHVLAPVQPDVSE